MWCMFQFCEVITVYWLKDISGHMVRIMLDYVSHVTFCSKLKAALMEQKQWPDICKIQGKEKDRNEKYSECPGTFSTKVYLEGHLKG